MSDADREMARAYCKVLGAVDPGNELLKYQPLMYLFVEDWCPPGSRYAQLGREFLDRFCKVPREELEQIDSSATDGLDQWFYKAAWPANHQYYRAVRSAFTAHGYDMLDIFWVLFAQDLDEFGRLRQFCGRAISPGDTAEELRSNWGIAPPGVMTSCPRVDPDEPYLIDSSIRWSEVTEDEYEQRHYGWGRLGHGSYDPDDALTVYLSWEVRERRRHGGKENGLYRDVSTEGFKKALEKRVEQSQKPDPIRRDCRYRWIEVP